jgi:hypothetical protein
MVSKKEQTEYFKQLLNKGLCKSLLNERPKDFEELMCLFKNHPDTNKLNNVKDIYIIRNKKNSKYFEFRLIKTDGTEEDISYRNCINKRSSNYDINQAFRNSIDYQIKDFRNNCTKECVLCGCNQDIHIDHIYLFKNLVKDFINERDDIPTSFDDNIDNTAIFKKENINFENEWKEYHEKHSTLRPLCKNCNLKRSKN